MWKAPWAAISEWKDGWWVLFIFIFFFLAKNAFFFPFFFIFNFKIFNSYMHSQTWTPPSHRLMGFSEAVLKCVCLFGFFLNIIFLRFIHVITCNSCLLFLFLYSFQLYKHTTIYFSILLLIGIWIISISFLWTVLQWTLF